MCDTVQWMQEFFLRWKQLLPFTRQVHTGSSVASSPSDLESSGEGHGQPLDNNNKKKATGHGHSHDIHEKKEGHGHSHNIVPSEDTFQVTTVTNCLDTATYPYSITKRYFS
jgi:hypothetical protein